MGCSLCSVGVGGIWKSGHHSWWSTQIALWGTSDFISPQSQASPRGSGRDDRCLWHAVNPGTPLLLTLLINLDDSSREAGPASAEKELRWGSHHLEMRRISQQRSRLEPFHSRYVKKPFCFEGGWAARAASEGLVWTELPTAPLGPHACTRAGRRRHHLVLPLCLSSFKTFILLRLESMLTVKVLNIYKRERKATHHPCENIYPPFFSLNF